MFGALLGAVGSVFGAGGAGGSAPEGDNIRNAVLDGKQSVSWGSTFQVGGVGNSASSSPSSAPLNGFAGGSGLSLPVIAIAAIVLALLLPGRKSRKKGKK